MQFATKQLSCKFTNSTRLNIEHAKFSNWTKREKRIKFSEEGREKEVYEKIYIYFFYRKNDKKKEKEEKKQDMNEKPGATRGKL